MLGKPSSGKEKMWTIILIASFAVLGASADVGPEMWRVEAPGHHIAVRALADEGNVDVWGHTASHTKVLVEAEAKSRVARALDEANLKHSVEVPDVLALVEEERAHMQAKRRKKRESEQMDWTSFHDLEDIERFEEWLNSTAGNLVQMATVARTLEGREVRLVRITDPTTPGPKKKIWIEGGIHAREWISPAVTTYLMHQVAVSPEWRDILKVTEWYFVPVANPDGYAYSFSSPRARLWRKNRSQNGPSARCKGVDLNRNWNLKWGVGASGNPCSETFKGKEPFSEPETVGLGRAMQSVRDIDVFITFHSFGQTVLYPWGWTRDPPANVKQLSRLARKFNEGVKAASGGRTEYEIGGSGPLYGLASGASDDWAYGAMQVPFSYTIELPDTGSHGFLLPESEVSRVVFETSSGMHCMIGFLTNIGPCARHAGNRSKSVGFRGFRG